MTSYLGIWNGKKYVLTNEVSLCEKKHLLNQSQENSEKEIRKKWEQKKRLKRKLCDNEWWENRAIERGGKCGEMNSSGKS